MITHTHLNPKPRTMHGEKYQSKETVNVYNADIEPGVSIRIYGVRERARGPIEFDKTFRIGDWAEYDSYNMSYCGKIVGIGKNTVTIMPEYEKYESKTRRLDLHEFSWRNWDFSLEDRARRNADFYD